MQQQTAVRKQQKARLCLQGDPGSGKTLSALLMAYGLTGNWSKIVIIDTEQQSGSFYSHLGPFNTVLLGTPYSPDRYIDAVNLCEKAGKEAVIIDSISHEWNGEMGILQQYCLTEGDKATKWAEVMPQHHLFINALQTSSAHIIATVRTAGEKVYQQKGYAHHFTTVLHLQDREAKVIKDRTTVFSKYTAIDQLPQKALELYQWCTKGAPAISDVLKERIAGCSNLLELDLLSQDLDLEDSALHCAIMNRREELEQSTNWYSTPAIRSENGKLIQLHTTPAS